MDYREILKRYMRLVGDAEGVYFNPKYGEPGWSNEEIALFETLIAEIEREDAARVRD